MTAKACERCGVVKPLEEFSPHRKTEDGRNRVCKECVSYRKRICKTFVHRKDGDL